MIRAVDADFTVDLGFDGSTGDSVGVEDDLRVTVAFEHVLVHAAVAGSAAAVSAFRVDHDFAGGLAGGEVVGYDAALEFELAADGVEDVTQREADVRLSGIERERGLLAERLLAECRSQEKK